MTEQQQMVYQLGSLFATLFEALSEGAESEKASWVFANLAFEVEEAMDELM